MGKIQKTYKNTAQKLGQHFLFDKGILNRIADSAQIAPDDFVLEVGPGLGPLSEILAARCKKLVAVELDGALVPALRDKYKALGNAELIHGDVLKLNLKDIQADYMQAQPFKVVANVPYYITTDIVMHMTSSGAGITHIALVVQREAAQRFCAKPGDSNYCAATAIATYYAHIERRFTISSGAFTPPPKVQSSLMIMTPRRLEDVEVDDEAFFIGLIKAAFSMRRKTIANNISAAYHMELERARDIAHMAGLDPGIRAEKMDLRQFAALARALRTCIRT